MPEHYIYYHYGFQSQPTKTAALQTSIPVLEIRVDSEWANHLPKLKNVEHFILLESLLMPLGAAYLAAHPMAAKRLDASLHVVRVIAVKNTYQVYYADTTIGYGTEYNLQIMSLEAALLQPAESDKLRFVKSTPVLQRRMGSLPQLADPHDEHLVDVLTQLVEAGLAEAMYPEALQHIRALQKSIKVEQASVQHEVRNVERDFLVLTEMAEQFSFAVTSVQAAQQAFAEVRHHHLGVKTILDAMLEVPKNADLRVVEKALYKKKSERADELALAHHALNLAVEHFYLMTTPALEHKARMDSLLQEVIQSLHKTLLAAPAFWGRRTYSRSRACLIFGEEYLYPELLATPVLKLGEVDTQLIETHPYVYLCRVLATETSRENGRSSNGHKHKEHVKAVDKLEKLLTELQAWLHKGPRDLGHLQAVAHGLQVFLAEHQADFNRLQTRKWVAPMQGGLRSA